MISWVCLDSRDGESLFASLVWDVLRRAFMGLLGGGQ